MVQDDGRDVAYTVLITIHSANNVPIADMPSLSADPYVCATIEAPSRPKPADEPPLVWRTPTARATRAPVWNDAWLVGGLPPDGFELELSVIDEDQKDSDDRLGKASVRFTPEMMFVGFDFEEREFKIQKRKGSIAPYIMTYLAAILPGQHLLKHPRIIISAKIVGKTQTNGDNRVYTVGPNAYTQHFSPLLGSVINRGNKFAKSLPKQETGDENKPAKASSFVATQLQLTGPVPKELKFHYVGYNMFIKWLYSRRGLSGKLLYSGLRKQYRTVYSYSKSTLYGVIRDEDEEKPTKGRDIVENAPVDSNASRNPEDGGPKATGTAHPLAFARQFLRLTGFGAGGRLQTYVLTLDGQWRFSETGDEFAVDFLSKHMMHADGAQWVAFAGEFFVRRIHNTGDQGPGELQRSEDAEAGVRGEEEDDDPSHYELVIDNDSGTYRPAKDTLPILQAWLSDEKNLGGLGRVTAMHCFDDKLQDLKKQRKELKKRLAGGELPKRHQAKRKGSSASSLMVDGRKLSSDAVERIVADAQKNNQDAMKTNGDASPQDTNGSPAEEAKGDAKHDTPNSSAEKPIQPHDSGIHV